MHLLERRIGARRRCDRTGGPGCEDGGGANRRTHDRRVAARRQAMALQRLGPLRLEGVEMLKIEAVTFVVNGSCFAWLAEVRFGLSSRYLAGSGRLPGAGGEPCELVKAAIRVKLQEWEDILRRR